MIITENLTTWNTTHFAFFTFILCFINFFGVILFYFWHDYYIRVVGVI